jgi:outer membrane protein
MSLAQLITDSGRTRNLVASTKLQAQAAQSQTTATKYDVVLAASQAYYEVLLAQQLVVVSKQTVAARQSVVDQTSQLFKNQLKSQVDLSFAQVNLSDANLMLLRAQDRVEAAYAGLAEALGTEQTVEYQLADQPTPPTPPEVPDGLLAQALRDRPEMTSFRLQREASQKFAYAERDLKRPAVSLMAAGGVLPYIDSPASVAKEYEAVGINVQIPVFNGFLFSARRQAAEYELQAADQRLREVENRIARDVRTAWANARTGYQAIGATADLLQQANLSMNLAQGRYDLGLASIVELTQAQLSLTQAQVQNVTAKYEYQQAYASLQYALGALH